MLSENVRFFCFYEVLSHLSIIKKKEKENKNIIKRLAI